MIEAKATRGRPRASQQRDIAGDILKATVHCLSDRTHDETTTRDIARTANTSPEMIGYYFGNKNGLLLHLVRGLSSNTVQRLKTVEQDMGSDPFGLTRRIVEALGQAFYENPHLTRVCVLELSRKSSDFGKLYLGGRRRSRALSCLTHLLDRAQDKGLYRTDIDVALAADMLVSLVLSPLMLSLSTTSGSQGQWSQPWIDHVTSVVHGFLTLPTNAVTTA